MRTWWRWLIWLIYVAVWTWALLLPEPGEVLWALLLGQGQGTPGPVLDLRQQLVEFMQTLLFSKGLHVTAYAGLAVLSAWLQVPGCGRWLLVLFMSLHGMGTEFLQGFEPSRHPSWRDVGLDHLGILLGMGLTWKTWLRLPGRTAIGQALQPDCQAGKPDLQTTESDYPDATP